MPQLLHHLRCQVAFSTAICHPEIVAVVAPAEVRQLGVILLIDQYVLWFDVPVDDGRLPLMQVLHSLYDIPQDGFSAQFTQLFAFAELVEQ